LALYPPASDRGIYKKDIRHIVNKKYDMLRNMICNEQQPRAPRLLLYACAGMGAACASNKMYSDEYGFGH